MTYPRFLLPSLAWFALLLAARAEAQAPETRIDLGSPPGAARSATPQIASSGSSVYVVWHEERHGANDVYFNRSLDAGRTWMAAEVQLDAGGSASSSPRIACAGSSVYVVWTDDRNGCADLYFNRSLDAGATWLGADVRVDSGTAAGATCSSSVSIAAEGSCVYVAWGETTAGTPTSDQTIRFRRSTDRGTRWETEVRLDIGILCDDPVGPAMTASGSGVYVLWRAICGTSAFTVTDLYFNGSTDHGASWSPTAKRLDVGTPPGTDSCYGHSLAASNSKVYAVWEDGRFGNDVYLNRSMDGGKTWLANDVRITPPSANDPSGPQVLASGDAAYVVWNEQYDHSVRWEGDQLFARSLDSGQTWSPAVVLNGGAGGTGYARPGHMIVDGLSLFFAWLDFRADPTSITFGGDAYFDRSRDSGATWLPANRRLNAGGWPHTSLDRPAPQLAASRASVYSVWSDTRNGEGDVFFVLPLGIQPYGSGTPGSGGFTPALSGSGEVSIGGSLTIDVTDGLSGAPCALVFTLAGPASTASPFGTILLELPWSSLPSMLVGSGAGTGSASVSGPIPNNPSLLGLRVNVQAGVLDAGAVHGIALSDALEVWVM